MPPPPPDTLGFCLRDDPRLRIGWVEQRLPKEAFGCRGIAFDREQEIDGLPSGIHGSIQISILPFDPDVGLTDSDSFYWSASGERGKRLPSSDP